MNNKQSFGAVVAIVTVIALMCLAGYGLLHLASGRGGTSNADAISLDTSLTAGTTVSAGTILYVGGTSGLAEQTTIGTSCNTASSTLFSVANPTSATSSVVVEIMNIGGNATTSSLAIGTTTKSSGLASTDVSASLVNTSNGIATSTLNWLASGVTVNSAGGFTSAGAGTVSKILVKPGERIAAYATTTATGAGAANYTPGFSTCTYKLMWRY